MNSRILVVDDEPQIQRFLKPALTVSGFEVLAASNAREGLRLAVARSPDLIILDLGLPDADGKAVISEIRSYSKAPIIVLSARDQEQEKVESLDLGADDYIQKPFGIAELLARIRTALRRGAATTGTPESYAFRDIAIDAEKRVVARSGEPIHLTPKEYEVLLLLARNAGRVVTHAQVLRSVWGEAHIEDVQYLRVTIAQLRGKIERSDDDSRLIVNEPAVGYRLVEV